VPKTTHSTFCIYYHIILTVKYRKKLLNKYDAFVKSKILEVSEKNNFLIEKMESDNDHIHILVSATPRISPYQIVFLIKQYTSYELWKNYEMELGRQFWKSHMFWTRSYFINTIGSVSKEAIERYIANQGRNAIHPRF